MKKLSILYVMLFMVGSIALTSCAGEKKTEKAESVDAEHAEAAEEHDEAMEHEHSEEAGVEGGSTMWIPNGDAAKLMSSDFHYITGATSNIAPKLTKNGSDNVLELTADGTTTAFVFHKSYGNIGMIASLDASKFKGTLRLIHHAQNTDNYEFVAINGNHMKLGRIVNGKETIFNESDFDSASGWLNLRVSAAGTHFKGYINDKTITHGHGDKMKNGFLGVMLEGTGILQIKSIELAELEDE
uniref:hypothetical protein n=1 Tax=Roseivirga sp. TaxID=1964215 RepID=UPI0040472D7D